MPPTNLINDIEAEARNRNTIRNGNTQLTALSSLVASMEKNQKLETTQNKSLDKLDKTITKLTKNLDSLVKSNTTAGKYSAGFNKDLYQMQSKEMLKSFPKATDMGETNRLLKALLDKKTDINVTADGENKSGIDVGLIKSLLPLIAGAGIGKLIIDEITKNLPPWMRNKPGEVNNASIGLSSVFQGMRLAGGTANIVRSIKTMTDLLKTPDKLLEKAIKLESKGKNEAAEKVFEKAAKAATKEGVEKVGEKAATKVAVKMLGKGAGKLIPGVGAAIEGAAAIESIRAGNYIGAGLHGAGAVTSLIPGLGGVASIGLGIAGDIQDVKYNASKNQQTQQQAAGPSALSPSKSYIEVLKQTEGFSPKAYWDENGYAIGYGNHFYSDNSPVGAYDVITKDEADKLLESKIPEYSSKFLSKIKVPLKQSQFDALFDMAYNSGGVNDDIITAINNGDAAAAKSLYEKSRITASGIINDTLIQRRASFAPLLLKDGGITNGPTQAIIGEAGREAVIPLESDEGIAALAESMSKYNMKDGNNAILLQILKAVSSSDVVSVLQDINKNLKDSGGTMVSLSGFNNGGVTA